MARCRKEHLEPPAPAKVGRLVGSAVSTFEERFCKATTERLSATTRTLLDELVAEDTDSDGSSVGGGTTFFTELMANPAGLGLEPCENPRDRSRSVDDSASPRTSHP
ncbi:hypothetical protein [Streptomyces aureoversilis]|uniref:Uncharacterized protein n=1 Tax=Streptomyces aureoversilis TaxID=67277 RepID=A0ABW0A5A4_9ACTN